MSDTSSLTLWRDNRIDKEWQITSQDLIARFAAWDNGLSAHPLERRLRAFICDPQGLSSVFEEQDFGSWLDANFQRILTATQADRHKEETTD